MNCLHEYKGGWTRPPCEPARYREASAEADGQGEGGDFKDGMGLVSSGLVYKPNSHTSTVLENFPGDTSHEKFLYT